MKSALRNFQPLSSCMNVAVVPTNTGGQRASRRERQVPAAEETHWQTGIQRRPTSLFESWLQKALHLDPLSLERKEKAQSKQSRRRRRGKRRSLLQKLFGSTEVEEASNMSPARVESYKDQVPSHDVVSPDQNTNFIMASAILKELADLEMDVFKPTSEEAIAVMDAELALAVAVSEAEAPAYVEPPVQMPMNYTMQDRCGGTLVAGHFVLFTNAAFKRKQRQLHYHIRSIPEDNHLVVLQPEDDEEADNDDEEDPITSEWV
ncbi:hypothetical protein Poli38472_012489 [Pythium oligandrum]|uniref:Uncharacterized protein n=1 Tax=Pythium oligandrum TaxID=41045 RepID=A0A8K1CS83_PYTOL|nr:hypothetical protein Poli38472_012489 [Pythium oligandrum]|eukprot:TMW67373.1 hypothetical protein Poli38472_012489 [Pythium oligandrum]